MIALFRMHDTNISVSLSALNIEWFHINKNNKRTQYTKWDITLYRPKSHIISLSINRYARRQKA